MASDRAPETVRDADLTDFSTFRLPARAAELVCIESPQQLAGLVPAEGAELILGGGSNTIFVADFPGRVVVNRMRGIRMEADGSDVLVTAAAGENWHALVRHCLDKGLYGIENLVMIPGSVGAAPMQNIGAYGVELADRFEFLLAFDRESGRLVRLGREDCRFDYRDSRFKSGDRNRFVIAEVTLRLSRRFQPNTAYASLAGELERLNVNPPAPRQLAAAVMRLRRHRLPDPGRLPNAGSFFKNPVVDAGTAAGILAEYPDMPHWPASGDRSKLAAAWMIERLGWKGRSLGRVGVYENHALVLVNRGGAAPAELLELVDAITESVKREYGLILEPEPNLVGRSERLPS
ncbi:UDP-N-acetylmuramate dehydrogenase [Wenzhouxiangella sp. EGI_FJ10305]|uniref:UDP-N-acetylmuramate dehydrogenase n=1 Tax=Wenzhouxiangella sp. EGI_FJ10305 TaxID=3243768 RepID=UPI0035E1BF52